MKLQTYGVIFVLIFIPLILVLSYYISLQIDTLTLQNKYDKKLLDATYDALSAFEINTANEDLSAVSDALRTIIEASTNVFFNTLATNMGMSNASKSLVEPNVPALLYTLYDGYYIYTPTKVPTIITNDDGVAVAVGDAGVNPVTGSNPARYDYDPDAPDTDPDSYAGIEDMDNDPVGYGQLIYETDAFSQYTTDVQNAKLKTKSVLKSYIPYSARYYVPSSTPGEPLADISVVYSLDNYISISGNVKGIKYTKCGYLIPKGSVRVTAGGNVDFFKNYNESAAQQYIEESGQPVRVEFNKNTGETATTHFDVENNFETSGRRKSDLTYTLNTLNNHYLKIPELTKRLELAPSDTDENYRNYLRGIGFEESVMDIVNTLNQTGALYGFLGTFDISSISANADDYARDQVNTLATLNSLKVQVNYHLSKTQYDLDTISAASYYAKATIFSNWVQEFLNNKDATDSLSDYTVQIKESHLVEISNIIDYKSINGSETIIHDFANSDKEVFSTEIDTGVDVITAEPHAKTEIPKDSKFYTHKLNVIRNSIQYNLNLAMSTYNNNENFIFDYAMPVISDDEWNTILTHISLTSFMQGADCGLKKYNNYMIVSSSNNELVTDVNDICYVPVNEFNDENSEYHKINCYTLKDKYNTPNDEFIAFPSKEVKYDKIYFKASQYVPYRYDHKNLSCYRCVTDGNYSEIDIFDDSDMVEYNKYPTLRKAFYIGVGKIRNNVYKMTSFITSDGYEVIYDIRDTNLSSTTRTSKLNMQYIKAVELVFGQLESDDRTENAVTFSIGIGANLFNDYTYTIPLFRTTPHTESVQIDPNRFVGSSEHVMVNNLHFNNLDPESKLKDNNDPGIRSKLLFVKVIYK